MSFVAKNAAVLATVLLVAGAHAATLLRAVSPVDGGETLGNPGCGFAGGGWSGLATNMAADGENLCGDRANCTKLWSLHKFSKGYVYGDTYAVQTNHYAHITNFVGGADIPLTENALLSISNSLRKCRANGGTCIPRFAYTWDGWGGAEPDDFEMVVTHIRQLGAVVSQFRDVVPAVECGMIGAYGEMHTSSYTAPEYQNRVIGAWLECLPTNMALLARSPSPWMRYLGTTTAAFFGGGMDAMDQVARARMGFYNDGYLGTDWDYGTWGNGGGTYSWSRAEGRAFLKNQAVPYGGEFAGVTANYFDENVHLLDPSRFNIVAEWYDTHLSYLRTIRAYDMTVVQRLTNTFFSSSRWAFDGMPNLSEYDGADLRRFCEDHMGYRYVVRGVSFEGRPGWGRLEVEIENTGFGQLLFEDRPEVVLSGAGGTAVAPLHGATPSLRGLRGGETATLSLDFDYPAALPSGEYDVLLRVRVPLSDERPSDTPRRVVRFANEGGYVAAQRANYLCTIALREVFDITAERPWFAWMEDSRTAVGGRWGEPGAADGYLVRNFGIDSGIPQGMDGDIRIEVPVEALGEIPCPDDGRASFVFLDDGHGSPLPYGYCAEGWKRLHGFESQGVGLAILGVRFCGREVTYSLDGCVLRDGTGRTALPVAGSPRDLSALSFIGAETGGSFIGILEKDAGDGSVLWLK